MSVAVTSANTNNINNGNRVAVRTSAGIPYVVLVDATDASIEVWKGNSSTPTSFTEQDTANNPDATTYGSVSAAIDSAGIIHIVFVEYISKSDDLEYITFNTNTDVFAGAATIDIDLGAESTSVANLYTSIAIDANNIPHIAYEGVEANAGTVGKVVRYNNRIGGAWNSSGVEVEGQTSNKDCISPSIAINLQNIPVISYLNDDDDDLARATGNLNDATSFTLVDLDATALSGSGTSICVDSSNVVFVAGVDADGTVMVYNNTTQKTTGVAGSAPSLVAVGTDIYLFYEDANNDIAYNKSTDGGTTWGGSTVVETGTFNNVRTRWCKFSSFNVAPTVALNTPTEGQTGVSTTPTLNFTGTDTDTKIDYVFVDETASPDVQWNTLTIAGDVIEYLVEVDTVVTFNSQGGAVTTIDDEDAGYSTVGGDWTDFTIAGGGINNDIQYIASGSGGGTGSKTATWNFGSLTGVFTVEIHWSTKANRSSDAPYTVKGFSGKVNVPSVGGAIVSIVDNVSETRAYDTGSITFDINQQLDATGATGGSDVSSGWLDLGDYYFSGQTLTVVLSDDTTTGFVIADAVRITNLSPLLFKLSSIPDAGFTAGHPFASGSAIDYTVQSALDDATTYYWRVSATDPKGSDSFGAWPTYRSFVTGGGVSVSQPAPSRTIRHR